MFWNMYNWRKRNIINGGKSNEIRTYRKDNYECIKIIKDAHNDEIYGIIELKEGIIASYGYEQTIKIWSFILK